MKLASMIANSKRSALDVLRISSMVVARDRLLNQNVFRQSMSFEN